MEDSAAGRSLLSVALGCRCPRCGVGPLYDGLLKVHERCTVCGLDLSNEDAGDGAAVFVILILGALIVLLGFIVDRLFEPPLWVHILLWIPVTFVGAVAMLRPIKAALIAQQYRVRNFDGDSPGGAC
jgi:uncharacterized protein (DUF983 family)